MKAKKISPGPWTAVLTEIHGYSFYTIVSKTEIIAPVQRDEAAGGIHNANLLAAAPDLLKALKFVLSQDKRNPHLGIKTLLAAQRAVAKAEGKT